MAKKKNITTKQDFKKLLGQTNASKKTEVSEQVSSGIEKAEDVLFAIEPIEDDLARVAAAVTELEDIDSAKVPDEEFISTQANALSKIDELPKYGGSPLTGEDLKQQLAKIVEGWNSMNGIDDLCVVLNLAWQALYGKDAVKTTIGRMKLLARKGRYVTFKIPKKKKGEFRTIDAPCHELKNVQQALNFVLQEIYRPNAAAMGFVKGKSVVTNAQVHLCQNFVYNIDLKDFFPSITSGRVFKRLLTKPFCLNEDVASMISDLCCYQKGENKVLPQGAPTSPIITNIICEKLDFKLSRLAKAYGLKYTRYADDITFSGMSNVFAENGKFCTSMRNIIENEEGFKLNTDKTRLCHRGMRQEVTGLTVNTKANVSRKYIKQLRPLIHNWEVKGYDEAQAIFAKHYAETNTRNLTCKGDHLIENIISGKLMYLKMVKGETDSTYKSLADRFEKLYFEKFGASLQEAQTQLITTIDDGGILSELNNLAALIEANTSE
jgi:retron-type reverse transcriptase